MVRQACPELDEGLTTNGGEASGENEMTLLPNRTETHVLTPVRRIVTIIQTFYVAVGYAQDTRSPGFRVSSHHGFYADNRIARIRRHFG